MLFICRLIDLSANHTRSLECVLQRFSSTQSYFPEYLEDVCTLNNNVQTQNDLSFYGNTYVAVIFKIRLIFINSHSCSIVPFCPLLSFLPAHVHAAVPQHNTLLHNKILHCEYQRVVCSCSRGEVSTAEDAPGERRSAFQVLPSAV